MSPPPIALITGASRGIGAATARLAAASGWAVAVNYQQRRDAADAVVQDIVRAGGDAITVAGDVGDEEQVVAMFEAVDRHWGRPLSALVNNAGVVDKPCRVEDMSGVRLERMFRINVLGSFYCTREAVRRMSTLRGGAGGSIVNVSSGAALLGAANQYVDYAASKGAMDVMTRGLAKEVAGEGIRVNAVRPGLIDTDIHASGGLPHRVRDLQHLIPMQRGGSAEEVAEAILWLMSPASSYTTASFTEVSGGRL